MDEDGDFPSNLTFLWLNEIFIFGELNTLTNTATEMNPFFQLSICYAKKNELDTNCINKETFLVTKWSCCKFFFSHI